MGRTFLLQTCRDPQRNNLYHTSLLGEMIQVIFIFMKRCDGTVDVICQASAVLLDTADYCSRVFMVGKLGT